jgi:two-component system cell cycle sensor histidine kinase/response regulator CckA
MQGGPPELDHELNQILRDAFECSELPLICVSTTRGRHLFANEAFAKLIGRTRDEVVTADPYQIWLETTHPDDLERERVEIERVARGEIQSFELDKRFLVKGGGQRWVRVQAMSSRDAEGRLETLTVWFIKIDEQREAAAERERLHAQLLQEQKLGLIGKLAGGVAHDFNNRLLVITACADLLRRDLPPDSPLRQHAEMVLSSARQAAELPRQLLAVSRRQVLNPEAFDLNQAVNRLRTLLARTIGEHVELVTVLGATHAVHVDPGQIEQVLLNLVVNARDALPNGGRITLETKDVSLAPDHPSGLPPGEYVMLAVSDTGTGIAPEILPHVFEPFFTTKEAGRGTGLGLAMVEGIVQQSGGATTVDSQLGRGTSFIVYLPRSNEAPVSKPHGLEAPHDEPRIREGAFETVLVCDDDDAVRKLLADLLAFRGYRVLEARGGRHALDVAQRYARPIQLLVSDVVMPELGGLELAERLRQRQPELKVLFISGYTEDAARFSSLLSDDTRFLAKPFLPATLTETVCTLLERREPAVRRKAGA